MVDLSLPVECLNYTKKVLCIARMSKPKRFDIFLEMATLLPQYAFIWIGNQEKMMNLPNNVFCLGNIANAGIYNTQVDLFVLPSDYEGLPIVIIEAMSCGKPIVSSNVGGIGEIVYNGENGYVVNNNSIDFAKKIEYILKDDAIYSRFSARSLAIFNEKLTVDKMVGEYKKIYNR